MEDEIMKKAVIGILAHVDAGKTTLSESMLYLSGILCQVCIHNAHRDVCTASLMTWARMTTENCLEQELSFSKYRYCDDL